MFDGPDNFDGFVMTPEDITKFPGIMDRIKSFIDKELNDQNFIELCELCWWVIHRLPVATHWLDSNFIVRSRANEPGELFNEEWQVSYNSKEIDKIKDPSRFNIKYESMFYGALKGNDHKGDNVPTATLESCKKLLDPLNTERYHYLTLGKWKIKEPFHVLNLCYHEQTMQNSPYLRSYMNEYFKVSEKKLPKETVELIRQFMAFFAEMAGAKDPDNRHYFITNAFWVAVRQYYQRLDNMPIHGIIYPSCMTEYNGINIVLTPEAVDKYLELEMVMMYKFTRHPSNPKEYTGCAATDFAEVKNGHFSFSRLE